jgi:hypothetical protein
MLIFIFFKNIFFLSLMKDDDEDGETETEYETTANLRNGGLLHGMADGGAGTSLHSTSATSGDASAGAAAASPFLPSWGGRQATPLPPEPPPPTQEQQQQQPQHQQQQQFFSGDSQDSGKGYTSISVRYSTFFIFI